ncbi:MAG: ABC transporter permease [Kineosporiaceae bacterium]
MTAPGTGASAPGPARAEGVALSPADRLSALSWPLLAVAAALLVVTPVAFLSVSVLDPSVDVWVQQWRTRLPSQLSRTAGLLGGVAVGTLLLGTGLAWLVSAYRFPGSRVFGWLLVAPLAMPSYVLGFVVLSVAGYTGPVQGAWRAVFGDGAWFPEVRSLGGAVVVFTLVLYPYVYLLARAALADQAGAAYEAARTLGAGPSEALRRVTVPLLRPALAGGAAIVMMETLTDFATVQYFGVDTVSVGVFRIWRGTFDRDAASELATLVLLVALAVVVVERVLRGRARFGQAGGAGGGVRTRVLSGWRAGAATAACSAVVGLAFAAPTTQLVVWAVGEALGPRGTPLLGRFSGFLGNSLLLAAVTAVVCVVVAVVVTNAHRVSRLRLTAAAARLSGVGYGLPGPVVAIGVVLALVAVDDLLGLVGTGLPGLVATGSFLGLVYAYVVRFLAPGINAVEAGTGQIPEEVTASARSLGARPSRVTVRTHLPLARASVLTAAVLVAVDAVKELPVALLLRPIGFDTLPVWTWNLASESRFDQAALPALAVVTVAVIPVILLSRHLAAGPR